MEFNKIAGAVLVTLLAMWVFAKIGNSLVPQFHPPEDKAGDHGPATAPEKPEPEKPLPELLAAADPQDGRRRANACVACHSFEKGGPAKQGPNLWDIVGRKMGGIPGFAYSAGLKGGNKAWTYEDLFKYLANPSAMFADSKMAFRLPRAEHRAAVLAYLRTLSDAPKALPAAEKKPEPPQDGDKKPADKKPDEKK